MPHTLVSHTNAHTIRGRPTLKDVERFRNGLLHEFFSLEALKTLKNLNTSDVEKITDLDEQNLDVDRNKNKQSTTLDKEKDIQQNNLNCEFLSLTLVLNIVIVINTVNNLILLALSLLLLYYHSINRCHANFVNRHTRTYFR